VPLTEGQVMTESRSLTDPHAGYVRLTVEEWEQLLMEAGYELAGLGDGKREHL